MLFLNFIKTIKLTIIDNSIVLIFQGIMLLITTLLFIEGNVIQTQMDKFYASLLFGLMFYFFILTVWDTIKIVRFSFKHKNKPVFLTFDNAKMASFTKDGSFSVSYHEIISIQPKVLLPLPYASLKGFLVEVEIKKQNLNWFENVFDKKTKKYEIHIAREDVEQFNTLLITFNSYKEKNLI